MKNSFLKFTLTLLLIGCIACTPSHPSKEELVQNLNGYWKIHEVKAQDGTIHQYKVSTTVDYIEVQPDLTGIRRKLKPKLDSTYELTGGTEHFKIAYAKDSIIFQYTTAMDQWKEQLLDTQKEQFTVKNERGITYTYNRFESLKKELENHEKGK